jgi:hypothetical protein
MYSSSGNRGLGGARDSATQNVLAGGIHPVEQQHQKCNQQEIAVGEYQAEGSPSRFPGNAGKRYRELPGIFDHLDLVLTGGCRDLCGGEIGRQVGLVLGPLPRINQVADGGGDHQEAGGDEKHLRNPNDGNQPTGECAAGDGSQRASKCHDGEETFALLLGVNVVGKRPELSHDHQVEHAYPEEERHSDRHLGVGEDVEPDQADDEERCHGVE